MLKNHCRDSREDSLQLSAKQIEEYFLLGGEVDIRCFHIFSQLVIEFTFLPFASSFK